MRWRISNVMVVFGFCLCVERLSLGRAYVVKRCQTQSLVAKDSLVMTVQALRLNLRLCSRVQLARFDLVVSNMWVEAQTPNGQFALRSKPGFQQLRLTSLSESKSDKCTKHNGETLEV